MKKSNDAKNNTILGDLLLFVAIVLPILMIVILLSLSPPMSLSLFSQAFASHGPGYHTDLILSDIAEGSYNNNNNNQEEGLIGNQISQQQSPQADARNVNVDNKVIIVEGDCDEIIINDNDQIIQTNTQSFNQEANNQVREGGEGEEADD